MGRAVKRTISLPSDLAAEAERLARQRGTSLSEKWCRRRCALPQPSAVPMS